MIKITGKLWLLALCLSLIVSIPLASANEPEKNLNDNLHLIDKGKETSETIKNFSPVQKTWVCSKCGEEYVGDTPPDSCPTQNCDGLATDFKEKNPLAQKTWVCSKCGEEYVGDTPPDSCPTQNCDGLATDFKEKNPNASIILYSEGTQNSDLQLEKRLSKLEKTVSELKEAEIRKKQDDGIFYTIFAIMPWLLIVLCLIFVWKNIFFFKRKLRTTESQLKKIATPKSEGASELNTNQQKGNDLQLEERVSELERVVSELKEAVKYLLRELETRKKENKEEQQTQDFSQWPSQRREIPANNQRIHTESTTRPDQLSNKGISTSSTSNKSGLISGANRGLRLSPEIQKIIVAFNRMMLDSTKLNEGSMDLWKLRNNFIKDYNVIAFKCVNSQERVNHPEEQPRFEICQASESTLWRIQLSDGTFAVLPGLREYESTVHFQGGMKELFKSDYKSGTYRKIEMVSPAIVKRDFSINEQGELRLSQ